MATEVDTIVWMALRSWCMEHADALFDEVPMLPADLDALGLLRRLPDDEPITALIPPHLIRRELRRRRV